MLAFAAELDRRPNRIRTAKSACLQVSGNVADRWSSDVVQKSLVGSGAITAEEVRARKSKIIRNPRLK